MPELTPEQKQMLEEQKKQCIFCQIASGAAQAYKVYEDDKVLGILDLAPAAKGHVLLMPKEHYPIMPLVPEDILKHTFKIAKGVSQALIKALLVQGTNIFVANGANAGAQIPHFVVHIVPREENDGVAVFNLPKRNIDANLLSELQKALSGNLHLKLQDKLAEQGLLKEAEISEPELIEMIETNTKLRDFLKSNVKNLESVISVNPQLEAMFRGKDMAKIKAILLREDEDKQLDAVNKLLRGKKKAPRKDKEAEVVKKVAESVSAEPEETLEEKRLREKLSVKGAKNQSDPADESGDMEMKSRTDESQHDGEPDAAASDKFSPGRDADEEPPELDPDREPEDGRDPGKPGADQPQGSEDKVDLDDIANLLSGGKE